MKLELTRDELLLLRHALEFNTTGTHGSNFAQRVERLLARITATIEPHKAA
jgi:hypothetical protein